MQDYIERNIDREPDYLRRLERATNLKRVNGRMCSGHIQGRVLKMLTQMVSPGRALELGTFTGYSALCIAEGLPPHGELLTVEIEDELEEAILEAFSESPYADRIKLRIGDAVEVCRSLPDESFDFIFIDADKREYPAYYVEAMRLLKEGGYIVADNVLWDGHVADASRHDAQTEGVREFNRMAAEDSNVEVVILPVRDGLSVIRKKSSVESR